MKLEISVGHRGGPIDQTVTGVRNEPTAVSGERVTDVAPQAWPGQCNGIDRLDPCGDAVLRRLQQSTT